MPSDPAAILIVDDDELQRDLLAMQLTNLGYEHLLMADSGHAALTQLELHPHQVAVIITDLSMPDMDGLVLMRHVTQRGFTGALIVVSGVQDDLLNSAVGLASAHGLHVLGCLPKPCDPLGLQRLLADLPTPGLNAAAAVPNPALAPERLAAALAAGEFVAWYQPKVEACGARVFGVEALARWPQADGSFIGPATFVPALEAAGLVDDLFFAMARQAAASMALWRSQGLLIKAAINLSMDTALNLSMPEQLHHIVTAAGLSPADFVIEITESRLMVDRSLAMETITRLSLMGFALSIDDFGTGYSSLVQLIDLPFKELKIDGSFVQRASHELKAQTVLRIATLLGSNLQMDVIAEGVETPEQLDFLRSCGCTRVQGYYFAKPMPLALCTPWLGAHQTSAP